MNPKTDIKITYLFEHFPVFNQPYIIPVLEELKKKKNFSLVIRAFHLKKSKLFNAEEIKKNKEPKLYRRYKKLIGKNNTLTNLEKKLMDSDIVHIQHSFLFPKVSGLLKLPTKRPIIIITLRGGDTYIKPWVFKKWKTFYENEGQLVDAFITMSEHQKEYLQKWGVPNEKIKVIPISFGNSFKIEPKYPNQKRLRVVSVFRMVWEKNLDGNLQVIKNLKESGVPVQYDIYGHGPGNGQLYYLIDKYNLTDCVNIKGKIENKDLKDMLIGYDFLLQLSFSESLGMTVIEAQAYGVPGVVSNSGGLPELVEAGKTGIVVNTWEYQKAAKKIQSLWGDKDEYFKYSKNNIYNAQTKHCAKVEVDSLMSLYKELLQHKQ